MLPTEEPELQKGRQSNAEHETLLSSKSSNTFPEEKLLEEAHFGLQIPAFSQFYDNIQNVAILVIDSNNKNFIYYNPFAEKMLGYSKEESLVGKNYNQLFQANNREARDGSVQALVGSLVVPNIDFENVNTSGEIRELFVQCHDSALIPCNMNISRMGVRYIVITLQDLRLEKKREAEIKVHFDKRTKQLEDAAHELRTPGHGIKSGCGILGDFSKKYKAVLPETATRELTEIQTIFFTSDSQLQDIINTYLTGGQGRKLENFNLRDEMLAINIILSTVAAYEKEGQVVVKLDCSSMQHPEQRVYGERMAIRQVVTNIATNSIKFTKAGEVIIRLIETPQSSPDALSYVLSIKDTGPGMTEDQAKNMWGSCIESAEDFEVRSINYSSIKSSGRGLPITKDLIENSLFGTFTTHSVLGQGTEITVFFSLQTEKITPACRENKDDDSSERKPEKILRSHTTGKIFNVLAAEDNSVNRKILERQFTSYPEYCLKLVQNGAEAIVELLSNSYDAILMDNQMPGLSGIDAIRMIRRELSDPRKRHIPIIVVSASELSNETCAELGIIFILKPCSKEDLFAKIESAIAQASVSMCDQMSPSIAQNVFLPSFHQMRQIEVDASNTKEKLQDSLLSSGPNKDKRRCCTIL